PPAPAATAESAGPVPTLDATPPSTGPKSAPAIASPNTVPINSPRRPAGAAATSHARLPVHVKPLERPWRSRAPSSCHALSANPNRTLVTAIEQRPTRTVGLTPRREATKPAGSAPISDPAG